MTGKNSSRSFSLGAGAGMAMATATLSYSKSTPLTLVVYGPDGSILATQTGASPSTVTMALPPGIAQFVVSGTAQSSFTLTVTYIAP